MRLTVCSTPKSHCLFYSYLMSRLRRWNLINGDNICRATQDLEHRKHSIVNTPLPPTTHLCSKMTVQAYDQSLCFLPLSGPWALKDKVPVIHKESHAQQGGLSNRTNCSPLFITSLQLKQKSLKGRKSTNHFYNVLLTIWGALNTLCNQERDKTHVANH